MSIPLVEVPGHSDKPVGLSPLPDNAENAAVRIAEMLHEQQCSKPDHSDESCCYHVACMFKAILPFIETAYKDRDKYKGQFSTCETALNFNRKERDELKLQIKLLGDKIEALTKDNEDLFKCCDFSASGRPVERGSKLYLYHDVHNSRPVDTISVPPVVQYCWFTTPEEARAAALLKQGVRE